VGTAIHTLGKGEVVFPLVVQRWSDPQFGLFSPQGYCYHVIASSGDELLAEEVVWFHNQRGQAEKLIKEPKSGFGMEQMRSGDFSANALWFSMGVPRRWPRCAGS